MKTPILISFIFSFWPSIIYIHAQDFTLTIEEGYGSGTYQKGDSIHIWANKERNNEVFTHWSGNGAEYLLLDNEWHTKLVIPSTVAENAFHLKGNYDELGNWTNGQWELLQWAEINGDGDFFPANKIVDFAYPESPKAIVFLIHGTGGNSTSWVERYERRTLMKDLVYHDYAVFALNSNETTVGDQDNDGKIRWESSLVKQDTSSNIDFKNVLETKNYIFEHVFTKELPVFMVGGSNGANFTDFCTWVLDFKASAHMTGNGLTALFENVDDLKPILWIQSKNDNNQNANPEIAIGHYIQLLNLGIKTDWYWLEQSPAYPFRFNRSTNQINNQTSITLFDSLKNKQLLDEDDFLLIQNVNADFPFDDVLVDFDLTIAQENDFKDQLNVINADHGANGDFNKTIIRFFDECLPSVSSNKETKLVHYKYSIVPNPFDLFLSVQSEETNAPYDLALFDLNGHLVLEQHVHTNQKVNTSTILPGVYFIKIQTDSKFPQMFKLVKL